MIYIAGVPRSGKTELSNLIKEQYPQINQISTEAVANSIANTMPKISLLTDKDAIADFIAKFADWNELLTDTKSLIDVGKMPIEQVFRIKKADDFIICLGFGGDKTNEQIWDLITQHHQAFDYTFNLGLDKVLKLWGNFARRDDNNKFFCEQQGILYFDTSKDRPVTFAKILEYIKMNKILKK